MEMSLFSFALPSLAPAGGIDVVLILMRWIHLIAGVMWIGLLYFFVLVNSGLSGRARPENQDDGDPQADAARHVVVSLELVCHRDCRLWLLELPCGVGCPGGEGRWRSGFAGRCHRKLPRDLDGGVCHRDGAGDVAAGGISRPDSGWD